MPAQKIADNNIANQLISWYNLNKRDLPWRMHDTAPDPYKVWLSEIMLQQTTVTAVKPYYEHFIENWPTIHDLAKANKDEIMSAWAGLGYYSRARNLHKCAQIISEEFKGNFPDAIKCLKKLPGIGDYTSAAIRSIAFNKHATVIDGNVERIITRLFEIDTPMPAAKTKVKNTATPIFENGHNNPSKLAQSFMDLGSMVCTPKSPKCNICPISKNCLARASNTQESYPVKAKKKAKPQKQGNVYWISKGNKIILETRPENGLLGGMLGLPTTKWCIKTQNHPKHIIVKQPTNHVIAHSFTHFDLTLHVYKATLAPHSAENFTEHKLSPKTEKSLPTVFKKVYATMQNTLE